MNNKKYISSALFAMMLLGAQQTLPITWVGEKSLFESEIKRLGKNLRQNKGNHKKQIAKLLGRHAKQLAEIVAKNAPKATRFLRIFGGPVGGPVGIALTVASTTASGVYYWVMNKRRKAMENREQQLLDALNTLKEKYEGATLGKVATVALIGTAAIATPVIYWAKGKIQTLITNAKQKRQAETEEAKEIERTIAKAADMSVPELQAFLKRA